MNTAHELEERGLVSQKSANLSDIFSKKRTVYLGIDPTSDSMQVGNLAVVLLMKRIGLSGHNLIFLVGGATGMIGDPKEKTERTLLDLNIVKNNSNALKKQIKNILGDTKFKMVDNAKWLLKVPLIEFLRDIGKHFTVNDLIKRDVIRKRLDSSGDSISYTEFTYPLLQGYDFLTLYKEYGCTVQIAGADQWTNALSGVDLIRRKAASEAFVVTAPLITDSSGKKFGKSEGNAIWLDPKKTSPFKFYQFWVTLPDDGLETYFRFYTFMSLKEVDALMETHKKDPSKRIAQTELAKRVTAIVHGEDAATSSAVASEVLFGGAPLVTISKKARSVVLSEALTITVSVGTSITNALTESGLVSSKGEVRRLIGGKGVSLNGHIVEVDRQLTNSDFVDNLAFVRKGKHSVLVLILK